MSRPTFTGNPCDLVFAEYPIGITTAVLSASASGSFSEPAPPDEPPFTFSIDWSSNFILSRVPINTPNPIPNGAFEMFYPSGCCLSYADFASHLGNLFTTDDSFDGADCSGSFFSYSALPPSCSATSGTTSLLFGISVRVNPAVNPNAPALDPMTNVQIKLSFVTSGHCSCCAGQGGAETAWINLSDLPGTHTVTFSQPWDGGADVTTSPYGTISGAMSVDFS